ncbi:MAG: DUF883 domain-containing protein [Verrucomicrobiae bacterium]|nr:DUF883 domain-containing protein [Verrucomicrobiae bacterium]
MSETDGATTKDRLIQDFRAMLGDFESLMRDGASQLGEKAGLAREQLDQNMRRLRSQLEDAEGRLRERGKVMAKATDDLVHDHPWESAGVAFGVGLLIGILINRR